MQKYLRSDTLHALCPFFHTSPGTQFANILQFIIRIKFVVRSTYDCVCDVLRFLLGML